MLQKHWPKKLAGQVAVEQLEEIAVEVVGKIVVVGVGILVVEVGMRVVEVGSFGTVVDELQAVLEQQLGLLLGRG